jgi:peptidoglycan/xylan/chitin deacetylase (PgdA/CDA1 family)
VTDGVLWVLRLPRVVIARGDEAWAAVTRRPDGSLATLTGTSPVPAPGLGVPVLGSLAACLERGAIGFAALAWAEHAGGHRSRRAAYQRAVVGGTLLVGALAASVVAVVRAAGWHGHGARPRAAGGAGALAALGAVVAARRMGAGHPDEPERRARAAARVGRVVALTFDDGPGRHTPAVLQSLDAAGVPATFFVVGDRVRAHLETFRATVAGGHEVGSHSMTHTSLVGLPEEDFVAEVDASRALLEDLSGRPVRRLRPPYGNFDEVTRERLAARSLDMSMWTLDVQDYLTSDPAEIARRVARRARPGAIVLLHDGDDQGPTAEAVPQLIQRLEARGFRFDTMDGLEARLSRA